MFPALLSSSLFFTHNLLFLSLYLSLTLSLSISICSMFRIDNISDGGYCLSLFLSSYLLLFIFSSHPSSFHFPFFSPILFFQTSVYSMQQTDFQQPDHQVSLFFLFSDSHSFSHSSIHFIFVFVHFLLSSSFISHFSLAYPPIVSEVDFGFDVDPKCLLTHNLSSSSSLFLFLPSSLFILFLLLATPMHKHIHEHTLSLPLSLSLSLHPSLLFPHRPHNHQYKHDSFF